MAVVLVHLICWISITILDDDQTVIASGLWLMLLVLWAVAGALFLALHLYLAPLLYITSTTS